MTESPQLEKLLQNSDIYVSKFLHHPSLLTVAREASLSWLDWPS